MTSYPVNMGIIWDYFISHYQDPYSTNSIMESKAGFFSWLRWWNCIFFRIFNRKPWGNGIHFDEHIFQMVRFNHQLARNLRDCLCLHHFWYLLVKLWRIQEVLIIPHYPPKKSSKKTSLPKINSFFFPENSPKALKGSWIFSPFATEPLVLGSAPSILNKLMKLFPYEQWKKTWLFSVYRGLYYPVL